ncbi:MAG: class I SAM-dependent methyltransferase [Myxococcota bacterium]|nr:class I SAM-dependent methyltransferase [Myxococcota bacterium]
MDVALERVPRCDLCGGQDLEPRRVWRDQLLFGTERWTLVRCRACKLHFINPRPTRDAIGAFYPATYLAHNDPPAQPKAWHRRLSARDAPPLGWWERARMHVKQDTSWYRFPAWRGQGRVLDIGCGNGARYLDILKGVGWTTHGLDASLAAAEAASAKGHIMRIGSAEDDHYEPASMDVVTMWHALEHTHSPKRALAAAFRVLAPGGILTLAVPNYGSLQAKLQGGMWSGVEVPRHLYQFTRATLRAYLEEAGFRITRLATRSGATAWPRAFRHLVNTVFHRRWERDPKWIVELFEPGAKLGSVFRYFGVGGELRVIAERPG